MHQFLLVPLDSVLLRRLRRFFDGLVPCLRDLAYGVVVVRGNLAEVERHTLAVKHEVLTSPLLDEVGVVPDGLEQPLLNGGPVAPDRPLNLLGQSKGSVRADLAYLRGHVQQIVLEVEVHEYGHPPVLGQEGQSGVDILSVAAHEQRGQCCVVSVLREGLILLLQLL